MAPKIRKIRASTTKFDVEKLVVMLSPFAAKADFFDDATGAQGKWDGSHYTKKKRSDAPDVETLRLGEKVLMEMIMAAPNGYPFQPGCEDTWLRLHADYGILADDRVCKEDKPCSLKLRATKAADRWRLQCSHLVK